MKAGFAERCITPDGSCRLAGYYKVREKQGVHDDLYVRVARLGDLLLIQLDLLNVDHLYLDALYEELADINISSDKVLVFCIHTHSAFGGILDTSTGENALLTDMLGHTDGDLLNVLVQKTMEAVREANDNMQSTLLRMANGTVEGIATNRHSPEMPSDNGLFAIEFLQEDGGKVLLYNLSCHPTILNADNMMLSADIPGATNEILAGDYKMVMFANGAAGDMSTRFTRRESSFDECRRMGGIIAESIRGLWTDQPYGEITNAEMIYEGIYLTEAAFDTIPNAERKLAKTKEDWHATVEKGLSQTEIRLAKAFVEGAEMNLVQARINEGRKPGKLLVKTGLLQLNDRFIVCAPLELYSILALELKRQRQVELIGYANNLMGYMADEKSYDAADYEALSSRFDKGQGEKYIQEIVKLLN